MKSMECNENDMKTLTSGQSNDVMVQPLTSSASDEAATNVIEHQLHGLQSTIYRTFQIIKTLRNTLELENNCS